MFTVKKQFAPFLRMLSTPIAPKHYFTKDKHWKKNFDRFLSSNTNPSTIVSSGAFRLKEYVPAQRVIFEKNPNYYEINKNGEKLPYLDKIVYLIVGDLNNEILKFEAGELDEISLKGGNVARYKARENNSDYIIYNLGIVMFIAYGFYLKSFQIMIFNSICEIFAFSMLYTVIKYKDKKQK